MLSLNGWLNDVSLPRNTYSEMVDSCDNPELVYMMHRHLNLHNYTFNKLNKKYNKKDGVIRRELGWGTNEEGIFIQYLELVR